MYGENDPVARYYDHSFALGTKKETEYYKSIVDEVSGPVGDLCCGTGVLAVEFASPSRKVYAIDSSISMLKVLKSKITERTNIEVIQDNMSSFTLPEQVARIICRDAFFHNLTVEEQRATLRRVNAALCDGGVFAFNIHVPNPKFLASLSSDAAKTFSERGCYDVPESDGKIKILQTSEIDYYNQTIKTTLKFEKSDSEGSLLSTEYSEWKSRYTFPWEIFYLLELAGFEIRNAFGTYDRKPWNENSMLIIEARKIS